ncbi:MAG: hypothetical protein IKA48_00620 [Fibrobacter sp.]|nr:hypothetical protein [Fibrobacter sp.]
MIRNACYLAIFLHFLRKIFRRALPPTPQDGVHRYLVTMGPYRDDKIGSRVAVVASTNDIVLARRIAKEINGGVGPSLYIVSYPDMRVLDLITSFPHDKEEDIRYFERELPDMSFWSVFGDTGGSHIQPRTRDRIRTIAAKYGQSYQTTDT